MRQAVVSAYSEKKKRGRLFPGSAEAETRGPRVMHSVSKPSPGVPTLSAITFIIQEKKMSFVTLKCSNQMRF